MISIHTTTQVVTSGNLLHFPILCNFNPHHHAGGDHCLNHWHFCNTDFNPHHHAGGDQYLAGLGYNHQNFNPHHHAGGDSKSTQLFILISVNFHINLLLQPLTTSKPSKSIPKTPTTTDSPGANLPGVSWVLPIRTGVSEN